MIKLQNVRAGYGPSATFVAAVDDVSLTIHDNEILGIAGESGCGKSTLIRTLYGDFTGGLKMMSGSITGYFRDRKTGCEQVRQAVHFSELWWELISYVPQGSMSVLNPIMKIEAQFVDSLPRRKKQGSRQELRQRIASFLADFGLPETVLHSFPHQLSGGMRQRVLVAMAAFIEPNLILADEPTTALDVLVQKKILLMMVQIQRGLEEHAGPGLARSRSPVPDHGSNRYPLCRQAGRGWSDLGRLRTTETPLYRSADPRFTSRRGARRTRRTRRSAAGPC